MTKSEDQYCTNDMIIAQRRIALLTHFLVHDAIAALSLLVILKHRLTTRTTYTFKHAHEVRNSSSNTISPPKTSKEIVRLFFCRTH